MSACSLPIVLQSCLNVLAFYLSSPDVRFGRSGKRLRGMRSDRRNNILAVAAVLIRSCCLQHGGVFCRIEKGWARLISIPEMAARAGIVTRTVSRCLADLVDLGLIECKQIKRKNPITGQLEVSVGIRRFTNKFWKMVNLAKLFDDSIKWAKENGKRRLIVPFKKISLKLKKTYQGVDQLVKSFMKDLTKNL